MIQVCTRLTYVCMYVYTYRGFIIEYSMSGIITCEMPNDIVFCIDFEHGSKMLHNYFSLLNRCLNELCM